MTGVTVSQPQQQQPMQPIATAPPSTGYPTGVYESTTTCHDVMPTYCM